MPSSSNSWRARQLRANTLLTGVKQSTPVLLLVGTSTYVYGAGLPKTYNTALLADPEGKIAGRYYKMHAVMFGEYVPLADRLPWLATATPLGSGMSVGSEPQAFEVAGLTMSPSICFESVVPQLIRSHLLHLERQGKPADVLVSVTNDGWFWGSAILDHHLACAVHADD